MSKETLWFRHDLDTAEGRKFTMLRLEGGYEAHGIYWRLIPHLYKSSNRYPFATIPQKRVLADRLNLELAALEKFVALCIECENLLKIEDGYLCSDKVAEEIENRQKISKKNAESGSKGGQANATKALKRNQASTVQTDSTEQDRTNNKKSTLTSADFIFPFKLENEIYKRALDEYIQHRRELKKPLTKIGINKLLGKYANQPNEFLQNLNHSIANGWQGIHAPNGAIKQETLPDGFSWIDKENVKSPTGTIHHISFIRNMTGGQAQT